MEPAEEMFRSALQEVHIPINMVILSPGSIADSLIS